MSHFATYKKSGLTNMCMFVFFFLLLAGTEASAQYIYSAASDVVDAYTTPMTASVAHSAYIGKVGDGRVNAVRFNTFYKRWNSTEPWTKMQSNLRSLSLPGFVYDTTMLIGLDPRNAYQMHTQMEFIEHNSAGNISIVITTVNIVTEDIRYQFVPVQWKFVNEYPTKARFDSITFNSTIFTPVPNPRAYRNRMNWSAPDVEYKMYVVYDYTENVRFGQEKQAESYVPMSADQPVTVALYDSLRISGLTMNQDYLLVPILEVRSSDGKGGRYQTPMSAFKTGIPTGVRLQDSSGKIVASSARDNATARVEYGLLKTTPEMRELYERAFSGEPLAKVSEVAHFLQDTGSYSYTFSKNNTSTFDFRDPKYPHHAGALMAYRVGVREAGADSSIYYSWDPQYPGIEKNSTYTLVSQFQQKDIPQVVLNPAIQEPLHYRDTIILSATVIKGKSTSMPQVVFFWGKDSTKPAERWTERVVQFDKNLQKPPVALVTSTHISHLRYRPLTKYYYGAIGDNENGIPKLLYNITTASNAEVSGHNVEMADDGSLIPTFSANVKVNDLGGKLYFEYGKTTAYGSKTAVVDIPVVDDFSTFRQFSAAGAKLDANAVYHFRAVMFDSAKNETYYTDDIEFISTFDASLGSRWFVQGMNTVFNTFSFPASTDPAITKVDFALRDSNNTNMEVKTITSITKGNWQATFDMAKLQPKSTLHITGYNSSSTAILEMTAVRFGVLKNPGWLPEVADVYVDHDKKIIYYTPTAHIPFPSLERTFSSDLKFLANQTNSIANIFMPLEVEYNIATHKSKVSGPSIKFDARAATKDLPIGVSLFGKAVVDDDFGLDIELGGSVTGPTLPILAATGKFSFEDGLVEGELNCGISCTPVFDFDFLIGNPGFAYPSPGLVHIGSKSSYIDAGLDFFGGVKGSLSVAKGVGSVSSSLGLDLPVLIGVAFAELPENYASFIWGGDMSLKGNITVKVAGIKVFSMSKKFFSQKWGTIPSMHKRKDDGSSIYNLMYPGHKGEGILSDRRNESPETVPVYSTPAMHPTPSITHRDSTLAVVWLDDTEIGRNRLWLNTINYQNGQPNSFKTPVVITENTNGMSHPQSVLFKNGSAFVAWTQSRYDASSDQGITMNDLFSSQDIHGAWYDAATNSVRHLFRFKDEMGHRESGRMEGRPQITSLGDTAVMAAWIGGEANGRWTNPYFSVVSFKNDSLEHTEPQAITDMPGTSRDVFVAGAGNNKAVAVWINNPNTDLDTPYNRLMTALWNGTSWETKELIPTGIRTHIGEIDMQFTEKEGVLAITSLVEDTVKGNSRSLLTLYEWDFANSVWNEATRSVISDTTHFLKMPDVAISPKGIASVAIQKEQMYMGKDKEPHLGDVDMFFKNLSSGGAWKYQTGSPFAMDTNFFEWELETGFANDNTMFILTQENELGSNGLYTLVNGVRFGKTPQQMVLRAIRITDDLTMENAEEPQGTVLSVAENTESIQAADIEVFPNPASERAVLSFTMMQEGHVTLELYNALGVKVATLVERDLPVGSHVAEFAVPDVASGAYSCVITVNGKQIAQPLTIVK